MNKLTLNQETGFLESPKAFVGFVASKKVKLLKLAKKAMESGKYPSKIKLARAVGISIKTLDRHLEEDEHFNYEFSEVFLMGREIILEKMFENAQKPNGFMWAISWLRRYFPEWHPQASLRVQPEVDREFFKRAMEGLKDCQDADVLPNDPLSLPPSSNA